MKVFVQDKLPRFEAEQFLIAKKPWPSGIRKSKQGGYEIVINPALTLSIKDGDWIVHRPSKTEVVSNLRGYDIVEAIE